LTPGDPRGIGPEITLKAWNALRREELAFAVAAPAKWFESAARQLALPPPVVIHDLRETSAAFAQGLPVLPVTAQGPDAAFVASAIEVAVRAAQAGEACAIVTNPIHKKSLYDAGFAFPGHTEYLAHLTGATDAVMMLVVEGLRAVPVTVHRAVKDAVAALTTDAILRVGRVAARELTAKFGIARPRLAVAALNPHAGEDGAMGHEEIEIIAPAIRTLQAEGIDVVGPAPVDTLFHPAARTRYDAAICMLHDHALLPVKTLDFDRGVNVTLGLPIIRTSPDHGTAFDIAGKGIAKPDSLIAAIRLAAALSDRARP
jgi:4-hydroxythreonine-4-phosphate dehydrogenase